MAERIIVYGAGAIGAQVGARMHAAGHDATLVEPWPPQRQAIAENGLRIDGADAQEFYRPPAIAPEDLSGPVDVCFLAVKSYDTQAALERLAPHLSPGTVLVSLQNAINEEHIAPVLRDVRIFGGVILVNAVLEAPGHIQATLSVSRSGSSAKLPGIYLGEYLAKAGATAQRVAELLSTVWSTEIVDDLLYERWSKLVNNTMFNPVSGISGLSSAAMLANSVARRCMIGLAAEVLRVAEAEGHLPTKIMGEFSVGDVIENAAGNSDIFDRGLAERAARVSPEAATSLLQDVRRGRKTEVDYFSGEISRRATRLGITTPFCDAATELVHRVERGMAIPSPDALQQLLRMARGSGGIHSKTLASVWHG
ncbi:MAG: ketopantoate reductase family protein [Lysobacterales bacterium]|nr:MAG: ketopantoate reductase family protein [Xanthomonadales bacterium]